MFEIKKTHTFEDILQFNTVDIRKKCDSVDMLFGQNTNCQKYTYYYAIDSQQKVVAFCSVGFGEDKNLSTHKYRNIWIDTLVSLVQGYGRKLMKCAEKHIKRKLTEAHYDLLRVSPETQKLFDRLNPMIYVSATIGSVGFYERLHYLEIEAPREIQDVNEFLMVTYLIRMNPRPDKLVKNYLSKTSLFNWVIGGRIKLIGSVIQLTPEVDHTNVIQWLTINFINNSIVWKVKLSKRRQSEIKENFLEKILKY